MNFPVPLQALSANDLQIDIYGFANGRFFKSYPLYNGEGLSDALRQCKTGPLATLAEKGPRPPAVAHASILLPRSEDDLFRVLNGTTTSNSLPDNADWHFARMSDGSCSADLITHKAGFIVYSDTNPNNFTLGIKNKSKVLNGYAEMNTVIDGVERRMEVFDIPKDGTVPFLNQRFIPRKTLEQASLAVDVSLENPDGPDQAWDSFIIPLSPHFNAALARCSPQ